MESFSVCWDLVRSISLAKDQKIQSDLHVWRGEGRGFFPDTPAARDLLSTAPDTTALAADGRLDWNHLTLQEAA